MATPVALHRRRGSVTPREGEKKSGLPGIRLRGRLFAGVQERGQAVFTMVFALDPHVWNRITDPFIRLLFWGISVPQRWCTFQQHLQVRSCDDNRKRFTAQMISAQWAFFYLMKDGCSSLQVNDCLPCDLDHCAGDHFSHFGAWGCSHMSGVSMLQISLAVGGTRSGTSGALGKSHHHGSTNTNTATATTTLYHGNAPTNQYTATV